MKKTMLTTLVACALLSGCGSANQPETSAAEAVTETAVVESVEETTAAETTAEVMETEEAEDNTAEASGAMITPLPDTTMNEQENATFAVSFEKDDVYVDDSGIMQMDLTVYSYELFDMVDIAGLKVGDTILIQSEEVVIDTLDNSRSQIVIINGGLEEGGYELITDETGVYYEFGFDDAKSWYPVGEATYRVSTEFEFKDLSDFEKGETIYYPGDFLSEETEFEFSFNPYSTTVRIEDGQIVYMEKLFTP